jgi:hypothetical protein
MSAEHFAVSSEDLAAHAEQLRELARRVGETVGAGQSMPPDAYGLVGQVFAVVTKQTETRAVGTLSQLTREVEAHARQIDSTWYDYFRAETAHARVFDGMNPDQTGAPGFGTCRRTADADPPGSAAGRGPRPVVPGPSNLTGERLTTGMIREALRGAS